MGDASGWVNKELLACANDCNHPTICMDTDDCACVEALFCPPPQRFPFLHRLGITYPPLDDRSSSLPEIVEQTSWMSVLRPEAARYLSTDPSWPSVHIAAVDTTSESLRGPRLESVARLLDRDCFSADASMEMALRGRGRTSAYQADIIFQPYYHARMWTGELSAGKLFIFYSPRYRRGGNGEFVRSVRKQLSESRWPSCNSTHLRLGLVSVFHLVSVKLD